MPRPIAVKANAPQYQFLKMPQKFRAFVAGFGSGKTWVGCMAQCAHYCEHPGINQGYFAPTYPILRDIFYPTIEEVAHGFGMSTRVHLSNKEVHFYRAGKFRGTTLCRSMSEPNSIVGFKIGRALVDELDTLPTHYARDAWRKIIARMRYRVRGVKNGIDVTTTPEGFKFTYQQFHQSGSRHYGIIQASTYDNEANLPDDYIDSLIDTYPDELVHAYLHGQFVNLTSGVVYRQFSRDRCLCDTQIEPGEPLHIGQDFNIGQMSSVVMVVRADEYHAVRELIRGADTPATIDTIKQTFPGHPIIMYPDASGGARASVNASTSDIALLRGAGFTIRVKSVNPFVRDRVLAMNGAFDRGQLKINPDTCPELVSTIEQQAYDPNGEPDKTAGHDHLNDACGYVIAHQLPINRPLIKPGRLVGTIQ